MNERKSANNLVVTEAVIILNESGIIRWASSSVHLLLGYLPDELMGINIFSLVCRNSSKEIRKLFRDIYNNPTNINQGLKRFLRKDGEQVPLFVTLNNISDLPEMSGVLLHLKHFTSQENTCNLANSLNEVDLEIELRNKIHREIAAELHDHVNSALAGVKLILDHSLTDIDSNYERLRELSPILGDLIKTVRGISHSISKKGNSDFELYEALNLLIERVRSGSVLRIVLKYDKALEDILKNHHKMHMIRIIHEQIKNIINHANATKVLISFQYRNERVVSVTRDNGRGFEPDNQYDGIGLSNMYYRVNLLGGNMHINSKCNEGTTIAITFPAG